MRNLLHRGQRLIRVKAEKHDSVTMAQLQNFVLYMAEYQSLPSPQPASTMPEAERSARVLLVVDGYFSLGRQNHDDRNFSISWLIIPVAKMCTLQDIPRHNIPEWGSFGNYLREF
jgi:hypothetical protein